MRRALPALVAASLVTAAASAAASAAPAKPRLVATVQGQIVGVAQSRGSVAWLTWNGHRCRLTIRTPTGAEHSTQVGGCGLGDHDLALPKGPAVIAGYEEVRCSETEAIVRTAASPGGRVVQDLPSDCRGYGTTYQGLATDGTSAYYALLTTREPTAASLNCGEGSGCAWKLQDGRLLRIVAGSKHPVAGAPAAVLIAGTDGRLALVQPAASASSNGKSFDWPRAATGGKVVIFDPSAGRTVTTFAPHGIVRAVALSPTRAAVVVQEGRKFHLEWYDAASGRRLAGVPVPASTSAVTTDGAVAAYAAGNSVHVVDLSTGRSRLVASTPSAPVGLSVDGGRIVWGENPSSKRGRVVAVATG